MAFQAGGPALRRDRGLEAVAYAYDEMTRVPAAAVWAKPQGKAPPILRRLHRIVPRGIATVIGCSTFPDLEHLSGLFASLATGNAVIVKPHPGAILVPLALTVRIGREVLAEAGFDPDVLLLLADEPDAPVTRDLVTDPRIGVIDFTGSPVFGRWLRENSPAPAIHTEEAGVNSIVIDGTSDFKGMCQNVAFSLSLYTGQMCTAPQNVFVPRGGIDTDDGHKSFDEVAAAIARGIDKLLADPERAAAVLGAVQNPATVARVNETAGLGRVVRPSGSVEIPGFPGARTATPLILAVDAATDAAAYTEERFGPISFIVATDDTADSISRAAAAARTRGAITAALYSTDEGTVEAAGNAFARAGVPLSVNLTGGIFVNQSAAFSDYHVTGGNPAGNACLTDSAFVANRFRVATMRRPRVA
ncbi:MAG: phenylacetic acid degradation protein PaaN [Hyphomicrobiales bacterium]